MLKRNLTAHSCERPIHYSDHNTCLENNKMIYSWEFNKHNMYVIQEIIDEDNFLCFKMGKIETTFKETPTLNWKKVGVYKKGKIGTEHFIIERKKISGKVLEVQDYLITCPKNILREQ